jgi:hypothetical protein
MQRMLLLAGALLLSAAVLVPAASAERPDDQAGPIGIGRVTAPASPTAGRLATIDQPGLRTPGGVFATEQPTTVVVAGEGFDWQAAGVGVAVGLGLALLAAALFAATTHRGRVQRLA